MNTIRTTLLVMAVSALSSCVASHCLTMNANAGSSLYGDIPPQEWSYPPPPPPKKWLEYRAVGLKVYVLETTVGHNKVLGYFKGEKFIEGR